MNDCYIINVCFLKFEVSKSFFNTKINIKPKKNVWKIVKQNSYVEFAALSIITRSSGMKDDYSCV